MESAKNFIKQYDKNNDGSLSRNELPADLREGFGDIDSDKDGKRSAEELKSHAQRMVVVPVPVEVVSVYVVEAGNDSLSREQLQAAYEMLRKADGNNDGKLSEDEIKAARQHAIDARVDAIFKRADQNNDGKISKDECPDNMNWLFKQADKDGNGEVTKEEAKACCTKAADESNKSATNKSGNSSGSKK